MDRSSVLVPLESFGVSIYISDTSNRIIKIMNYRCISNLERRSADPSFLAFSHVCSEVNTEVMCCSKTITSKKKAHVLRLDLDGNQ